MASGQEREEVESKGARLQGEAVEAQEHLAQGRRQGGLTRKEQIGHEGYKEMGRKGGLSTTDESGGERAAEEGIPIDESKFTTKNHSS